MGREHMIDLARNHPQRNAWIADACGTMMRILYIGIKLSNPGKHLLKMTLE